MLCQAGLRVRTFQGSEEHNFTLKGHPLSIYCPAQGAYPMDLGFPIIRGQSVGRFDSAGR